MNALMKIPYSLLYSLAMLSVLGIPTTALATEVEPASYDMPNGDTGSFNYWDDSYTGAGAKTTNNAPLTGGLGDLTDDYIEPLIWSSAIRISESIGSARSRLLGEAGFVNWSSAVGCRALDVTATV